MSKKTKNQVKATKAAKTKKREAKKEKAKKIQDESLATKMQTKAVSESLKKAEIKKTSTKKNKAKKSTSETKAETKKVEKVKKLEKSAQEKSTKADKSSISDNKPSSTKQAQSKKSIFSQVISALVGEKKELRRYDTIVEKVLEFEKIMQNLTDSQLKEKTEEFRKKLKGYTNQKDIESKLLEILPEAFAVVREAAHRVLGQKPYPVQLIAGMVLNEGRIAEMKTGEGKTLSATLPVYLNALPEKNQVHLVTVNDYLARRDASWMGKVYDFLGLSVGVIQNQASFYFKLGAQADQDSDKKREIGLLETYEDGEQQDSRTVLDVENLIKCDRKRAYWDSENGTPVDVVYGVNSEFGFDYLRDNMANTPDEVSQKAGHKVAIVDEVDSILIDEARTPLIISSQDQDSSNRYKQFAKIASQLTRDVDYDVDEKRKNVTLTQLGLEKVEGFLKVENLYGSSENVILIHHLDQALKAKAIFNKDKEYVVRDGEIVIVDENTGRLMFGRRFNQGLHQSIEAKEGVEVKAESKTTASITFQNFFRLYDKLAGMTGTAATESEELYKIYKLLVVTIPTNRPIQRQDYVDKIFKTEAGKFLAIAKDVKEIHSKGQPVLIGTTSIEKNFALSQKLTELGVKHEVLNAKNHEQEARIISQAGRKNAVTLATNIAGRGIDIKLGGEPPEDKDKYEDWKKEHEEVKKLGGLYVIGTERHESRRIDNQLRGRSGRQGDPGESQFYVSLQDYVLRVFGGDRIVYYGVLPIADDEAIQDKRLAWLVEQAQKKIEGQNYDVRKHVTEYDDVINRQRKVIYTRRKKVLFGENFHWKEETEKAMYREVFRIISEIPKPSKRVKNRTDIFEVKSKELKNILKLSDFDANVLEVLLKDEKYNYKKVATFLNEKLTYQLRAKWEIYQENVQSAMCRYAFLRAIDVLWMEHLVTIDQLQDSVRLRGYSQKDPLTEFKEDGLKVFINLLEEVDKEVADTIFKLKPEYVPAGIMKQDG